MVATNIHEYWQERARRDATPSATTDDHWLRELEYRVLSEALTDGIPPGRRRVLDAGCGDGHTTLRLARIQPDWEWTGIDYSEAMIANARRNLAESGLEERVRFDIGEVTGLGEEAGFDGVVTVRCLINLEDDRRQSEAVDGIARSLKPGGIYVAIENFIEGHTAMNEARARLSLPEIPVRWHNHYFTRESFAEATRPWFEPVEFRQFASTYYMATRVLYSAWCRETGAAIDYSHDLHRLAVELPACGGFSPVCLAVLRRRR